MNLAECDAYGRYQQILPAKRVRWSCIGCAPIVEGLRECGVDVQVLYQRKWAPWNIENVDRADNGRPLHANSLYMEGLK